MSTYKRFKDSLVKVFRGGPQVNPSEIFAEVSKMLRKCDPNEIDDDQAMRMAEAVFKERGLDITVYRGGSVEMWISSIMATQRCLITTRQIIEVIATDGRTLVPVVDPMPINRSMRTLQEIADDIGLTMGDLTEPQPPVPDGVYIGFVCCRNGYNRCMRYAGDGLWEAVTTHTCADNPPLVKSPDQVWEETAGIIKDWLTDARHTALAVRMATALSCGGEPVINRLIKGTVKLCELQSDDVLSIYMAFTEIRDGKEDPAKKQTPHDVGALVGKLANTDVAMWAMYFNGDAIVWIIGYSDHRGAYAQPRWSFVYELIEVVNYLKGHSVNIPPVYDVDYKTIPHMRQLLSDRITLNRGRYKNRHPIAGEVITSDFGVTMYDGHVWAGLYDAHVDIDNLCVDGPYVGFICFNDDRKSMMYIGDGLWTNTQPGVVHPKPQNSGVIIKYTEQWPNTLSTWRATTRIMAGWMTDWHKDGKGENIAAALSVMTQPLIAPILSGEKLLPHALTNGERLAVYKAFTNICDTTERSRGPHTLNSADVLDSATTIVGHRDWKWGKYLSPEGVEWLSLLPIHHGSHPYPRPTFPYELRWLARHLTKERDETTIC